MMIRKLLASIVSLTTLMLGGVVFAQSGNLNVMSLPPLDQYVTDFAGVLDQNTLTSLNTSAYNYYQTSGHQFVAVLIPDRQGYELFDIALKIFNDNGIGAKKENDGLLLVIATTEKKIRIMVGYGLEAEMPDVLASQIIEQYIRPLVNSGDYAGAIQAFYQKSQEAIQSGVGRTLANNDSSSSSSDKSASQLYFVLISLAIAFGSALRGVKKGKMKKKSVRGVGVFSFLSLIISIIVIGLVVSLGLYGIALAIGYMMGGSRTFGVGGPFFGGGSGFGGGSFGGGSFGGFSGGGGSSGGGGAGD